MSTREQTKQRFTALLDLLDTKKNAEELVAAVRTIVALVKSSHAATEQKLAGFEQATEDFKVVLRGITQAALSETKETVEMRLNKAIDSFSLEVGKMLTEQAEGMKFIYDKVRRIKEGKDGKDGRHGTPGQAGAPGKDADEAVVAQKVRGALWEEMMKEFKKLREENRQRSVGSVSGGTSAMGVQYALGRIVKSETPSGAIDGANTSYTTTQDIHAILSFGINGMVIHDNEYTVAGRTITMTTAIPTALSGTNFRIVYV